MTLMDRLWIGLGALAGLSGVAMAAAAAHALPARLDPAGMNAVRSAVQMQGWHAAALVLCGVLAARGGVLPSLAGACFAVGLLLFCGAVYGQTLGELRLGPMAPVGGTLLMLGWILLGAAGVFRA
jgi:uncharacterized membrane protein YgdD (TMEM256/DUF423 family)